MTNAQVESKCDYYSSLNTCEYVIFLMSLFQLEPATLNPRI